jgi:hypothetical protein
MKSFDNSFTISGLFGKQVKDLVILPSLCSSKGQKLPQKADLKKIPIEIHLNQNNI